MTENPINLMTTQAVADVILDRAIAQGSFALCLWHDPVKVAEAGAAPLGGCTVYQVGVVRSPDALAAVVGGLGKSLGRAMAQKVAPENRELMAAALANMFRTSMEAGAKE